MDKSAAAVISRRITPVRESDPTGFGAGFVVMAGKGNGDVDRYRKSGVVDTWLLKPFSPGELKAVLDRVAPEMSDAARSR